MSNRFIVFSKDYGRLMAWFQFFPREDQTINDRVLAEKLFRSQWDPNRAPGQAGHSIALGVDDARRVRLWFDHTIQAAVDDSDEEYVERLDEFLSRPV